MTILQMEYLLALSETKKIYQAAQKCYISQSAFSQNLAKIEAELGTQLFIRSSNEWNPTSAGVILLNSCRQIVNIYKNMEYDIAQVTSAKQFTISLGMSTERALLILTNIWPLFHAEYPNYSIRLVEGLHSYLQEMTNTEAIDLSLTALPKNRTLGNSFMLNTIPLCDEELVLIAPKNHRLSDLARSSSGQISLSELNGEKFIQYETRKNIYHVLHSLFQKNNICPDEQMFFNSAATCIGFVQKGMGISIVPRMLIEENPDLSIINLDPPLYWELTIVYNKSKRLSTAERRLISLIRERIKSLIHPKKLPSENASSPQNLLL